ncbi:MAG: hypothetical protein A2289_19200 [Deltaproteobacteria bacterium RIFOXYA12_FULL_58_15]|nr:MAG: hypothetical protein A2289_19200 [Deltaproteobacteria bacterium RIFOXYA12_FULL_58_15]
MQKQIIFPSLLLLLSLSFAGCGAGTGHPCSEDTDCSEGSYCKGGQCSDLPPMKLLLEPWGALQHHAYPSTEVTLKVVAYRSAGKSIDDDAHLTPAANEAVAWFFIGGDPGDGAGFPAGASSATDANGIAQMTVNVGTAQSRQLMVRAAAAGAESSAFTITVGRDDRQFELLVPTVLDTVINRSERLRIRLVRRMQDGASGPPVAGASIQAEFTGGVRNGAGLDPGPTSSATLTTDGAGMASVRFKTGTAAQSGYQVRFSATGVESVTVTLDVALRGSGGADCQYFTDCQPGYICDDSTCLPAAAYCNGDANCPSGYFCNDTTRQCELINPTLDGVCASCFDDGDCTSAGERCGDAGHCVPADGCINNDGCPDAWTCDQCGACLPSAAPDDIWDVNGLWFTNYHFDISDTLPGFLTHFVGPVIDFLNLVFAAQLQINIPIVGDILEAMLNALVEQYIPAWARTVVSILADFIHLFENMEVEGEMFIVQPTVTDPTPERLSTNVTGQEDWTSAQFFVVSFCPGGPAQFNSDPSCGQFDIILDSDINVNYSNDDLIVDVEVDPFTGQVMGDTLRLYGRNVEFDMSQMLTVMLDVIIQIASNGAYADFETFLVDAIPCEDFQYAIDDLFCDITDGNVCSVPGIEAICDAAAIAAVNALHNTLSDVRLKVFDLEFDQRALIHNNALGHTASILGNPDNPRSTTESAIMGGTEFGFFGGELDPDSWWFGLRDRD